MRATTPRPQSLSLSRFVPIEVLRQLAAEDDQELQPRQDWFAGTVLFADISGFTRLSERLGKRGSAGVEELTQTLNDYFGELIDIVLAAGGDIVKFAGDALLAVWRAADQDLSEPVRTAAQCGLAAQSRLHDRKTKDGEELSLRIGIGAGVVITTSLGGVFKRFEYVTYGKAVSEATKAAEAAARGDVVLGPTAANRLSPAIKGEPLPEGRLRLHPARNAPLDQPLPLPALSEAVGPNLLAYIPAAIRQRLNAGHTKWLGELRRLTVLFVNLPDLNDQTSLPIAQNAMRTLQNALYRYEGSVNKLSADDKGITFVAAMGLPPLAHEDDELRGVLAALDLKSQLLDLGWRSSIGVTSGRVFCGIIGSTQRCEYTMIGDVVNLSARLMQAAQGGILCDHATFLGAQRQLEFETLPPIALKGKSKPVLVYRPTSKRRVAATRRFLKPMVGRESEQRRLEELQQQLVEEARGSVTIIDGEPGIGKSRLVAFLRAGAESQAITTYVGSALDIERSTPYFAWRGIFRDLLQFNTLEEGAVQPEEVTKHLTRWLQRCGQPPEMAPLLNPVLAIELAENAYTTQMTQESRVNVTNDLLKRLLQIEAKLHPIQLILEDCHWMDSASWSLARLIAEVAEDFLLFLITRPLREKPPSDYLQIARDFSGAHLSLKPLSENDVEALVCCRLGIDELPRQVAELIGSKAQGNPLFGEELAFALRDSGVIRIADGHCTLTSETELAKLGFPDTVQGVVTSRIDRLVPNEQLTLKVASVIGRSFSCKILQDMFPVKKDRPVQQVQLLALSRKDLITESDPGNERDYLFRHVITQEVAYGLIPPTQRQELHRSIAEWYEEHYREDLSPFFALLAKHWSHTDQTEKTLEYLEKSGENAAKQFANAEVIQFFTQALKLIDATGCRTSPERRARWEREVAEACYNVGELSTSLDHFRSTLLQLRFPIARSRAGMVFSTLFELGKQFTHSWLAKIRFSRDAQETERRLQAARSYERLAQIHYLNNARLPTIHAVFKALNLAEAVAPSAVLARCYANAAVVAGLLLMHGRARTYARRANQVAAQVNEPDCTSYVGLILGIYWVTVGEWDVAEEGLIEAIEIAERIGARRRWSESTFTLVIGCWRRGELDRCRELARHGVQAGRRDRVTQVQLWGLSWWLQCLLDQSGEQDPCRQVSADLTECLKHTDLTPADRILGHGVLASAHWRLGETEAAFDNAEQAIAIISETNQVCHYVLPAYSALFEVYSGLWLQEQNPTRRKSLDHQIQIIRKSLWEFGVMYPIGRVRHGLHQGQYALARGRHSRAINVWNKALRQSRKYRMPFEEGLLHLELALHGRGDQAAKSQHLLAARELLQQAGAGFHLRRLEG